MFNVLLVACDKDSWDGHIIPEDRDLCKRNVDKGRSDRRLSSHTVDEFSTRNTKQTPHNVSVESTTQPEEPDSVVGCFIAADGSTLDLDTQLGNAKYKIKEMEEEVFECKLDLTAHDAEVTVLQKQVSSLRAAQSLRDEKSGVPVEELIERNLNLEKKLFAQLKMREDGSKFTSLSARSREWFGTTKVDEGFLDIYGKSRQTLCRRENETVPFVPALVEHDDLRQLVSKCLAIPTEASPEQLQQGMLRLSKLSAEAAVRSLITSATADWVFATGFPNFDDHPSRTLDKYRELLLTQGN